MERTTVVERTSVEAFCLHVAFNGLLNAYDGDYLSQAEFAASWADLEAQYGRKVSVEEIVELFDPYSD